MDKYCSKCNQYKPIEAFSRNKNRKDGRCIYCKSCMNKSNSIYRDQNKDILNEKKKIYRKNNPEKITNYMKEYLSREDVKQRRKEYTNNYIKEHYQSDEIYRLKLLIRAEIYQSVTRKKYIQSNNLEEIIGLSIDDFINYLKKTYYNNYGVELNGAEEYQIDHIIPLATANTIEDIYKLCHYTNLQLLKKEDNRLKGAKVDWKL